MVQDSLESPFWRQWELVDMLPNILVTVKQNPLICNIKRIYICFVLFFETGCLCERVLLSVLELIL